MKHKFIHYSVQYGNGVTISDTDYSQYWKRFKLKEKKKLRGPIYGPRQAREHVAELRKHLHLDRLVHADRVFWIVKTTTTREVLATLKPKSNALPHRNHRLRQVQIPKPPDKKARA